jgi:hypothetical protein
MPVGIVLLDPTIRDGTPLWSGRTNWLPTPAFGDQPHCSSWLDVNGSWYQDICQATVHYPWFESTKLEHRNNTSVVVLPALHTICAEWLLVCQYASARIGRLERRMNAGDTRGRNHEIDRIFYYLSLWTGEVPIWRDMVKETLDLALPTAARLCAMSPPAKHALDKITLDYERVLRMINDLQDRVHRLEAKGSVKMQLLAAHEGIAENHNLARLTWLATIFVPMTFVSGLFSMTSDVKSIQGSLKVYFMAAIPVAIVSLVVARWVLHYCGARRTI